MTVTYEAIAKRAFEIWEREGRPEGRDQQHWFRAEHELHNEDASEQRSKAVLTTAPSLLATSAQETNPAQKRGTRPAPSRSGRSQAGSRP